MSVSSVGLRSPLRVGTGLATLPRVAAPGSQSLRIFPDWDLASPSHTPVLPCHNVLNPRVGKILSHALKSRLQIRGKKKSSFPKEDSYSSTNRKRRKGVRVCSVFWFRNGCHAFFFWGIFAFLFLPACCFLL